MTKPIYVVGGGGMLGNELSQLFDSHARSLTRPELDVTDKNAILRMFSREPSIIINASGYTDVNAAEANRDLAMAVNGSAVEYLADAAKRSGSILLHVSTDYVFDGAKEGGYNEGDRPHEPLNVYGASKLAGEEALLRINPDHYLVRTSWLFGRSEGSFPHAMLRLARERDRLTIVNDQHGKPTYVRDLACAIHAVVQNIGTPKQHPFGVYHLVNEGATTWYDYALKIFGLAGIGVRVDPISSVEYPSPAKRPRWSVLHNTKLPPLRPWQEALAEYLDNLPRGDLLDTTG